MHMTDILAILVLKLEVSLEVMIWCCLLYKNCILGWTVVRRIGYVENNWPYFLGFGMLLTTLTNLASSAVIR